MQAGLLPRGHSDQLPASPVARKAIRGRGHPWWLETPTLLPRDTHLVPSRTAGRRTGTERPLQAPSAREKELGSPWPVPSRPR